MAREVLTSNIWVLDQGQPLVAQHDPRFDYVDELLSKLQDDDRVILEMYFWQRLTYREIAELFGYGSRQRGHYYVQRALKRFKKILTEEVEQWMN